MLTIILTHHQQVILTLFHQYLVRLYWLSLSDRSTSAQSVYSTGHNTKALSWSNTFNLAEAAIIFHSSLLNFDEQGKQRLENYLCSDSDRISWSRPTPVPSGAAKTIRSVSIGILLGVIVGLATEAFDSFQITVLSIELIGIHYYEPVWPNQLKLLHYLTITCRLNWQHWDHFHSFSIARIRFKLFRFLWPKVQFCTGNHY